jgi:hypothetical protein
MNRLVLAAVVGAVLTVGLYTVSASSASADGGGITTTVGDQTDPLVAFYGPLMNAVDHLCPDGQSLTTGHLSKDDPLLNLCTATWGPLPGFKGANTSFTGLSVPPLDRQAFTLPGITG